MSTIKANQWLNLDNSENYKCRAWVNFNPVPTTPVIRGSGNVSSITDNGIGDYTVNFTVAMPDLNYAVVHGSAVPGVGAGTSLRNLQTDILATGSVRISSCFFTGSTNTQTREDRDVQLAIFR